MNSAEPLLLGQGLILGGDIFDEEGFDVFEIVLPDSDGRIHILLGGNGSGQATVLAQRVFKHRLPKLEMEQDTD